MPHRSLARSVAFAGLAAILPIAASSTANAQGLIDFLWGGDSEWGGGRQTVSFNPKYTPGQIIVSFGDRRLYHITAKGKAVSYPIAVPREQSRWQGTTTVSSKRENPSWRPTPEMLRENPKLPTWVPGGHPMNPLGVRALYLGASTYRIHGTDAPWTIGQAVSKGCIRMFNEDVLDLYPRIRVGTKVTVTWERFNSQAVASTDETPSFGLTAYKQPGRRTTIRNLPPLPRPAVADAQTAAVRGAFTRTEQEPPAAAAKPAKDSKDEPQATAKSSEPAGKKAAEKKKAPDVAVNAKPERKPEPTAKPDPAAAATSASVASAAEAARKAADAATRAAEAARKAAEAAKKAAADAKKATSSITGAADEQRKPAPGTSSAAL